jgi:hypothetical protein
MIRLENGRLRLPLDLCSERSFGSPLRITSPRVTHLLDILHPARKALEVAEEIKDALDGRSNLNTLFYDVHKHSSLHFEPMILFSSDAHGRASTAPTKP